MIKLKGDLMFDKHIIKILFDIHDEWNRTHIKYWLDARKITHLSLKLDKNYFVADVRKITKDTQYSIAELKGEKGILFWYL